MMTLLHHESVAFGLCTLTFLFISKIFSVTVSCLGHSLFGRKENATNIPNDSDALLDISHLLQKEDITFLS